MCEGGREERERKRDLPSIFFTPRLAALIRAGPAQSQDPEAASKPSMNVQGPKDLKHLLLTSLAMSRELN